METNMDESIIAENYTGYIYSHIRSEAKCKAQQLGQLFFVL